jgi:hypothetical protein
MHHRREPVRDRDRDERACADMGILRCRKLNPNNDLADAALHSWNVRAQAQQ